MGQKGKNGVPVAAAAILFLSAASPSFAQEAVQTRAPMSQAQREAARAAQIEALQARLDALEAQLSQLRQSAAADVANVQRAQAEAPRVTLANARPTFATADGQFSASIRLLSQFDAARYDQSGAPSPDNRRSDASNPSDLNSGVNFRRARIGIDGTAFRDWNYAFAGEFGGGGGTESPTLNQAYVEYVGFKPWNDAAHLRFRIGAWATPSGVDASYNTEGPFLERASVLELVRNIAGGEARTGIGVLSNGEHWHAHAVLTGAAVANSGEFDEQTGYLTRFAFLPLHDDDFSLHLGIGVQGVIDPADANAGPANGKTIRLRDRPELRVDGQRFADTGALPTDDLIAYNLELGAVWRNLYAVGEVLRVDLTRNDGVDDSEFGGWYVQGVWTLTGESRRWSAANGAFQGVRPEHAFDLTTGELGAWEIATRYSVLDLNFNEGALGTAPLASSVRGGEQVITSLGLNWYPNNVVRFLLDYQWVDIDRLDPEVTGTIVTAVPGFGAQIGQDYRVISLRSQLAF